ncbi:MAG: gluconate 2-dehydrogenase subunit 3 family protein [Symploca sp. SIO2E9]|nr:gluconate 2-dehydrogenase subunit 3 family protein [Symploca sp. SIO2E9]
MLKYKLKRRDFIWKASQLALGLSIIGREVKLLSSSATEVIDKSVAATISSALNPEQINIIRSLTSIMIPTDENPGAKEAGIAEYIVQILQFQGTEAIQKTQQVLGFIDLRAMKLFGKPYNQLSETKQKQIVNWLATDRQLSPFWTQLRTMTVLRFYSLPIGYKPVGLPGPTIDQGGILNVSCS